MGVVVNMITDGKLRELKRAFAALDQDHSGTISAEEVTQAMLTAGLDVAVQQVEEQMSQFRIRRNSLVGEMNYQDFLAATIQAKMDLDRELLWNAFKYFDVNNRGFIDADGMVKAMAKLGRYLSTEEAKKLVEQADSLTPDGKIDFDEFCELINGRDYSSRKNSHC